MAENSEINKSEIVSYSIKISRDLLNKLKLRARSEGYTIQEAFNLLALNYTNTNN
jgi:hypothetical protein